MTSKGDAIASVVLEQFNNLPAKRKPPTRNNGTREWIPLSGIVAEIDNEPLKCLALATGMKCLPTSKLPVARGNIIHDWHAEVLAIRAFNYFLLQECNSIVVDGQTSSFLRRRTEEEIRGDGGDLQGQPFAWREDVILHMYCSEAPCGDASMELTMAAQEDASPWATPRRPSQNNTSEQQDDVLLGRACFSQLGVVRRKPARADAPETLSKSCSDKIALKQCTSLLNSLTSLLVSPQGVYLQSLVLPESQYSSTACDRSFSVTGRMRAVKDRAWPGGYAFRPFEVRTTTQEFAFSRRSADSEMKKLVASNMAVAWSINGLEESLIGGVLQGRKQLDPRGASLVSRNKMWTLAVEVASLSSSPERVLADLSYQDLKNGSFLAPRAHIKEDARAEALKGWVRNVGDSCFAIST